MKERSIVKAFDRNPSFRNYPEEFKESKEDYADSRTPLLSDVRPIIDANQLNEFIKKFDEIEFNIFYFCDEKTLFRLARTCKGLRDKTNKARVNKKFSQTYSENLIKLFEYQASKIVVDINQHLDAEIKVFIPLPSRVLLSNFKLQDLNVDSIDNIRRDVRTSSRCNIILIVFALLASSALFYCTSIENRSKAQAMQAVIGILLVFKFILPCGRSSTEQLLHESIVSQNLNKLEVIVKKQNVIKHRFFYREAKISPEVEIKIENPVIDGTDTSFRSGL